MNKNIEEIVQHFASGTTPLIPGKDYLPVARQNLYIEDFYSLVETSLRGQYAEASNSVKFCKSLKDYFHVPFAHMTNSGSSALLAALTGAREIIPKERKYVITNSLAFPTTVSSIYQAGFWPWYLDCDIDTLNVNVGECVEAMQEPDVAGVVLAHTLGFPFDASTIRKACNDDQFLLEDASDAWGAEIIDSFNLVRAGSVGHLATLSGYPAHTISMGEGGAVLCTDSRYNNAIRSVINWGRDCICPPGKDGVCGHRFDKQIDSIPFEYDHKYIFSRLGYNLKATEFQASLGITQLKRLDSFRFQRLNNYSQMSHALQEIRYLEVLPRFDSGLASPFGVPILDRRENKDTGQLIRKLESKKIGTRRIFGGNLLRQPAFREQPYRGVDNEAYVGADQLMEHAFWIGCWPGWTGAMTQYVVDMIKEII